VKFRQLIFSFLLIPTISFAQVITTAVPFLLIGPSPEGNGMAGILSSVITSDPFAMMANPGQLGFQSLTEHFGGATYVNKTPWFPAFNLSGVNYSCDAILVGASVQDVVPFPFNLSAGFGYARTYLNLGQFVGISVDPTQLQPFSGHEQCDAYSAGIGVEYGVRFGIGVTTKKVVSDLLLASASARATDVGMLLNVPVASLVNMFPSASKAGFQPQFDVNLSYGRSNVGGGIYYIAPSQTDPLPREATLGASTELGVTYRREDLEWHLVSFTVAREASDLLIWKDYTGNFTYKSGSGNLSFFRNIMQGLGSENLNVRKGFQMNVLEIAYFQKGSLAEPGLAYSTVGFGMRMSGVLKALMLADPALASSGLAGFILHHIDLQYSNSRYEADNESPLTGTTFSGLSIIIR
jgi:hypothetical protein